jgi:hypothetical protein
VKDLNRAVKAVNEVEREGTDLSSCKGKVLVIMLPVTVAEDRRALMKGQSSRRKKMKHLCEWYILHAKLIGAFYCWIPTVAWFGAMMFVVPFREVYLLRLVLSILLGGWMAARINDYGARLWLMKHRSQEGPATIGDGILIGAGVGMGTTFLPPLTSLIATNHPEEAKLLIILSWSAGIVFGGLIGGILASIGRRHLDHAPGGEEETS